MPKHTVVVGDTFWKLAEKYGCTLEAILAANPNIIPEQLEIGQIVNIPLPKQQEKGTISSFFSHFMDFLK